MAVNSRQGNDGRFVAKGNRFETTDELIFCYHADGELLFFTDRKNESIIKQYDWCKLANGYAATHIDGKQVSVHRLLTNAENGTVVDHINRAKYDNRIANLRVTDKSMNAFNCDIRKNNKSGVTGVWFRQDTRKWVAEIKKGYKKYCLGSFNTKGEAVKARKKAEVEFYGN